MVSGDRGTCCVRDDCKLLVTVKASCRTIDLHQSPQDYSGAAPNIRRPVQPANAWIVSL